MLFPNEPFFNVYDGVLGVLGFDDERPVGMWSHRHALVLAARITEYRHRLRVAEWTVADTAARLARNAGASDSVRHRLQACATQAVAEHLAIRNRLASLVARARAMEAKRLTHSSAMKVSPFDFAEEADVSTSRDL